MAITSTTSSVKPVHKIQLKVMVNKERNRVVYAEAGKDFADILFSFLTLPLGTIVRLLAKESNIKAVKLGSLSSLYQSVAALDEQYLWTPTCKEMLLNPRNSMADYCQKLKLHIDDTEPLQYFRCGYWSCSRRDSGTCLSTFRNQKCSCGEVMGTEVFPESLNVENGFVKETATFIISDDLCVMPNVCATIVCLLQRLGLDNTDTIQELTIDISKKEVVDLLRLLLLSKTPLTDFVFKKKEFPGYSNPIFWSDFGIGKEVSGNVGRKMDLKVIVRKSNGEILFAEAEEDFVDFLFSFLTFPLGGVLHMLEGYPSLGCLNNIYESMKELSPDRYIISEDVKDKLTKPKIAAQFNLNNQILPIDVASLPVYYRHTYTGYYAVYVDLIKDMVNPMKINKERLEKCVPFIFIDPKSCFSKSSSSGEFAKGPSTYMVMDDLVVTPISSTSAISYMNRSKVPLSELEEKVITIGVKEGLAILKASLTSPTALTNGLKQYIGTIKDPVKEERTIRTESELYKLEF